MAIRHAEAEWKGELKGGKGSAQADSGAVNAQYSFGSRFENEKGSNPEELIGAAHASCFSMALAHRLAQAGATPNRINTKAHVHLDKADAGFAISRIELETEADVSNIDEAGFQSQAEEAKNTCPVSRALKAVPITLKAQLAQAAGR